MLGGRGVVVLGLGSRDNSGEAEEAEGAAGTVGCPETCAGAGSLLAVGLAGKRTISWHLGHLTFRPSTSAGTVNVAAQLGQSTATLDMGRVLAAFPNSITTHAPIPTDGAHYTHLDTAPRKTAGPNRPAAKSYQVALHPSKPTPRVARSHFRAARLGTG